MENERGALLLQEHSYLNKEIHRRRCVRFVAFLPTRFRIGPEERIPINPVNTVSRPAVRLESLNRCVSLAFSFSSRHVFSFSTLQRIAVVIAMKIYTEMGVDHQAEFIQWDPFHQHQNLSNVQLTNGFSNQTEPVMVLGTSKLEDSVGIHIFYIAVVLTQMIAYASYSVNFFLYSFSGITFRTSLRQILRKFRKG